MDAETVQKHFPTLWREDTFYFSIVKNNEIAGLYGIIDRNSGHAEVFMTIVKKYRFKVINKNVLDRIINTPFDLGFTQVWSWTRLASWMRLLPRLKDVESAPPPFWDEKDTTKNWFMKGK